MWHYCIRMEFQKVMIFLDTTADDKDLPRFVTEKWVEVYDQKKITTLTRLKHQC